MPLRTEIEKALDELKSNEGGMSFQGLAVALGKLRVPALVASERKSDLGLDAYAPGRDGDVGIGLSSSITPEYEKVASDADRALKHYPDLRILLFYTSEKVLGAKKLKWERDLRDEHNLELQVISREDVIASLMLPENLGLCANHLRIEVEVEPALADVVARIQEAAREVTAGWARPLEGQPIIELRGVRLDRTGAESDEVLLCADLEEALTRSRRLVLEAPAGRGKTTLLTVLGQRLAGADQCAFLVDLPVWTASGVGILEYLAGMPAFQARGIDAGGLARVQRQKPFSFLLNGWNEVGATVTAQTTALLRDLERAFPTAGIIVATRAQHVVPPLPGAARVRLVPLTGQQRREYLHARLGDDNGERMRRQVEADRALEGLTRTPMILAEMTTIFASGGLLPTTKMGVLESVVRLLEETPEHRNALQVPPVHGRAAIYFGALARVMTRGGVATIEDGPARGVVAHAGQGLREAGQVDAVEPAAILGTLTAHHVLERLDYPAIVFRFSHQQFQEYYAAVGLESEMRRITGADARDARERFAADVVNEPAWAEPLRMVAERIGAAPRQQAVAPEVVRTGRCLIELVLPVDAIFAADLARLCGRDVWAAVAGQVGRRLREWHLVPYESHRRCAVAGMLASGAPDFADILVPLLSAPDEQVRLDTYHLWPEFHVSVLGQDWQALVRTWSEEARSDFVAAALDDRVVPEVIAFAARDPSMNVKAAAVSRLWWSAPDEAMPIVESMDDETRREVVRDTGLDRGSPETRAQLLPVLRADLDAAGTPWARLYAVQRLAEAGEPNLDEALKAALNDIPPEDFRQAGLAAAKEALDSLRRRDQAWVNEWVARRVAAGLLWPEHWVPLVTAAPEGLVEDIVRRCETANLEGERLDGMAAVVRIGANEAIAGRLFNTLRAVRSALAEAPEADHTREHAIARQLEVLLETLPSDVAVAGMLGAMGRPPVALDVKVATRVLSRTARRDREPLTLADGNRAALREYLKASVTVVLQQEDFDGQLKADLASALAQVGDPADLADLVALINADVERARTGRAARAAGDLGPRGNGGLMSQAPWHLIAVQDLDPVGAVDVLIEQLRDPEYTWAAAEAMCRTDGARILRDDEQYRELWKAREGRRPARVDHEQRSRCAVSLAAYLHELLDDGAEGPMFTPVQVAKALAAVDDDGRFAEVVIRAIRVAGTRQSGHCIDAAERLLANGVVLPTDDTVALVDAAWQARNQDNPNRWLIRRALNLLPFTTDPVSGVARVRELLATAQLAPHQYRDIIVALGESRCDAGVALLRELAEQPHVLEQCSDVWLRALARLDTLAARDLLLSWVDPDVPGIENAAVPRTDILVNQLADLARRDPAVGARMLALATRNLSPMQRERVAGTLLGMGTPEALMASLQLIDDDMEPAIPGSTWQHLEGSFIEHRAHPLRPNVYVMSAQAANNIRRRLFEMTQHDERRRASAFTILGHVEEWRLDYGRPAGEPRHPALESGVPWPPAEPPV